MTELAFYKFPKMLRRNFLTIIRNTENADPAALFKKFLPHFIDSFGYVKKYNREPKLGTKGKQDTENNFFDMSLQIIG